MERSQQGNNMGNDQRRDTSQPGREESVVNQQDQNRTTNSQENNETTNRPTGDASHTSGQEQDYGREQGSNQGQGDKGYREGQQDNDRNQPSPPDIGKDDADKTQRETPRM